MQNYFQAIWMLTIKLPQLISSNVDTNGMPIKIKTNLDCHIINQTLYTLKVKVKSLSRVQLFAIPRTVAYHAPPSMGFSRQEYWKILHQRIFPTQGSNLGLLHCKQMLYPLSHQGSPLPYIIQKDMGNINEEV